MTAKTNEIRELMKNDKSADFVYEHLNEYAKLLKEFIHANDNVELLMPDDEKNADQTLWYNPEKEH